MNKAANRPARQSAAGEPVAFIDLKAQRRRLGQRIDAAVARVLEHGAYILGPEVDELEKRLAAFAGAGHCVSCANGTDALALVLMAWGVKPGDAVFVPAMTFVATAEAVAWLGATPVFVDVLGDTFNLDPASLEAAIPAAAKAGLKPRAVIPVDLYGQPADYAAIGEVARRHGLTVLADAAQSFGATWNGKRVGGLAAATATSFYPAKPLGCYGDGGAVFTDDAALADVLRSLRAHGQGSDRYENVRIGLNGRLDTIQAAILLEKLAIFPEEIAARDAVAARYSAALADVARTPRLAAGATSVWAQYTLVTAERDRLMAGCRAAGVPTVIYYPLALSRQPAYRHFPTAPGGVPVAERLSRQVVSLPMHPYLDAASQARVIAAVRSAIAPAP
jgi:dTDP-4-amino-4,6-dideoxygalactose transaminase